MLFTIIIGNLVTINLTVLMCNYVTKNMVYDMDIIRSQYEITLKRQFVNACLQGTDYPPEWRLSTTDFNTHSTPNYCQSLLQMQEPEILKEVIGLGRTKYE
jgi:hypothetical protein